jgi:hypothetical protein
LIRHFEEDKISQHFALTTKENCECLSIKHYRSKCFTKALPNFVMFCILSNVAGKADEVNHLTRRDTFLLTDRQIINYQLSIINYFVGKSAIHPTHNK